MLESNASVSQNIIEVKNLSKNYGKHQAVKDISFCVKKGEIFGFLGPNGAGKSTTINTLIGLVKPTTGSCALFGKNIREFDDSIYRKIGVAFEVNNLYKRLSGRQNLKFYADIFNVDNNRIDYLLNKYELMDASERQVKNYSKGMKQRLLLCRALLHNPDLLILDEPTSGLDPSSVAIIHKAIQGFQEEAKTIFLCTHFMEEAEMLCSRLAFIDKGEIIAKDTPQALKSKYGEEVLDIKIGEKSEDTYKKLEKIITEDDRIQEEEDGFRVFLSLQSSRAGGKLDIIRSKFKVMGIHSREASLREVFMEVTGT